MGKGARQRWSEMTPPRKAAFVIMMIIQLTLAAVAWTDLARRPQERVRGPKWVWTLVIAVNFAGPLAYFRWGRAEDIWSGKMET